MAFSKTAIIITFITSFLCKPLFAQEITSKQGVFLAFYVNSVQKECLTAIETGDLNTAQLRSFGYRKAKGKFKRSIFPTVAAGSNPAIILFSFSKSKRSCKIDISPEKIDINLLNSNITEVMFRNDYKLLDGARSKNMQFFKGSNKISAKSKISSKGTSISIRRN